MRYQDFITSKAAPEDIILKALWLDKNGRWDEAHQLVDDRGGKDADRVHSYLHRKEGSDWNARYWYNRIGIPIPKISLDEEWEMLVRKFTI